MLDAQLLRKDIESVAKALLIKGYTLDVDAFRALEQQRKSLQIEVEEFQAQRNAKSKSIGKVKTQGGDVAALMAEVAAFADKHKESQSQLDAVQVKMKSLMSEMPNVPHSSVVPGLTEDDNQEISRWGEPRRFDFEVKDHVDIGEQLGGLDFELATKIAGSRFVVMRGDIARLNRALMQFMLDMHTQEHGYTEVYVPYLVNSDSLYGTGQLPKFEDDQFKTQGDDGLYLIPTAEVPVTNIVRDEILSVSELPLKMVAHTPCFRREAGSYGRDTRGMIRQHQFDKIELVQVVTPQESYDVLEELVGHAEAILQKLELPYRKVSLCGGDLGFSAAKTYDLEVWLPSQETYREISSCSNFESFQARRLKARYRNEHNKNELTHTINGSGLAVGRALLAILENCQEADGTVTIPVALRGYMGGIESISLEQ